MQGRGIAAVLGVTFAAGVAITVLVSSAGAKPRPIARDHGITMARGAPAVAHKTTRARLGKQARALVTRTLRSLQNGGGSGVYCPGGAVTSNTSSTQTCTFNTSNGICIQRSTSSGVVQTCTFDETSTTRNNRAIAVQVIVQRDPGAAGTHTQAGKQFVRANQMNAAGSNFAWVVQILKQSQGLGTNNRDDEESDQSREESAAELQGRLPNFAPLIQRLENAEALQESDVPVASAALGPPVSLNQQSQQNVKICQGGAVCTSSAGMTGNNLSSVYQSLRQRQLAANASSIDEHQNHDQGDCPDSTDTTLRKVDMCAVVDQHTMGARGPSANTDPNKCPLTNTRGTNCSGLVELYRQFQSARHTPDGEQEQDPKMFPDTGGLNHDIHQTSDNSSSPGIERIFTFQRARQVQRKVDAGTLAQFQDPRDAKGFDSSQFGSLDDFWFGRQFADQAQFTDGLLTVGEQNQFLSYDADTSGTVDIFQRGTTNGSSASNECLGTSSCHVYVQCYGGEGGALCEPVFPEAILALRLRG